MLAGAIGKTIPFAARILRMHGLTPFRGILTADLFRQAHPVHPAAKTVLIPEVVFWLMAMAALDAPSMAGAVAPFWASLRAAMPSLPLEVVTEEAFCTARGLLPIRFFLRVFAGLADRLSARLQDSYRWKGRRLLGIDGMDTEVQRNPHLAKVLPPPTNQHGSRARPAGRLVGLVGLWDGVCYAFRWTSLKVSEQFSARKLLGFLGPMDLLLADRNFPDKATFAGVVARGANFLFHLPSNRFLKLPRTPVPGGGGKEWYVRIPLPGFLRRQFPALGPELQVRILQYQIPGFRPSWLITSLLDPLEFPWNELAELYHERWRQETFHREWKHTLELSNLRSLKAKGLLKEVLVQLTINNVIRWMMAEATPRKPPVHLKFAETKRLVMAMLPAMAAAPVVLLPMMYHNLLAEIARQEIDEREGRSYPRQWDGRDRPKGHGKVATPARMPSSQENHDVPI